MVLLLKKVEGMCTLFNFSILSYFLHQIIEYEHQ